MTRFAWLLLMPAALLLFAQEKPEQAAQKPTEAWLKLVDAADYGVSWDQAAEAFKSQVTKEQWESAVKKVRDQTGKLKSRELKSAQFSEDLPGAPHGKYVIFQYDASFGSGSFVETVTAIQEKDGAWKVAGYFVKPA